MVGTSYITLISFVGCVTTTLLLLSWTTVPACARFLLKDQRLIRSNILKWRSLSDHFPSSVRPSFFRVSPYHLFYRFFCHCVFPYHGHRELNGNKRLFNSNSRSNKKKKGCKQCFVCMICILCMQAGFAGDDAPRAVFPSIVGRPRHQVDTEKVAKRK